MRRGALGFIALALLVVGAFTAINGPGGSSAMGFAGSAIKAGLVLGALWLALPQIQAAFRRLPSRVGGWFGGKRKPPGPPTADAPPPARLPRPRRRSNSQ